MEDQNIKTQKASFLYSQRLLEKKIKEEELTLSQGRKLFIAGILKIDDYNQLKKRIKLTLEILKMKYVILLLN